VVWAAIADATADAMAEAGREVRNFGLGVKGTLRSAPRPQDDLDCIALHRRFKEPPFRMNAPSRSSRRHDETDCRAPNPIGRHPGEEH
jgi:hypothetical protein